MKKRQSGSFRIAVHIVIYQRGVVAADGSGRVPERCQQILPDVADFGGVFFQTVKDKLDISLSIFKSRVSPPRQDNRSQRGYSSAGTDRLNHQLNNFINTVMVIREVLQEVIVADVLLDDFSIDFMSLSSHRFFSLPALATFLRKERN